MVSVQRYVPGEAAGDVRPGDFILTHRSGPVPRLIRTGQRLRFRGADRRFAHWSHAALVVTTGGTLVEAEASGVRRSPLERYRPREYHLVRVDHLDARQREAAAAWAESRVGQAFGFLELAGASLSLLTGQAISIERGSHMICSVLVARALERAGERFDRDLDDILPADLARRYGVNP